MQRIGAVVYRLFLITLCVVTALAGWHAATSDGWVRNRYGQEFPAWPSGLGLLAASIGGLAWLLFHWRDLD